MEKIINNKKYLVIEDKEFDQNENVSEFDFINKVSDIYNKSTHWHCMETFENLHVTKGTIYKFFKEPQEGEYVIIDDNGDLSMVWIAVEGNLMIEI